MRMGNVGFVTVTMILVLITAYCCVGTVLSRTDLSTRELESYYYQKEQELVRETREFLNEEGFVNSGVMLTRVVDTDGSRQYTLTVHHGSIDKMDEEDRQMLLAELEKFSFIDAGCTFHHEFLMNQ